MAENFPNIGFISVNYPEEEGGKWRYSTSVVQKQIMN